MTSAQEGVLFDFYGDGHLLQLAWTDPDYSNGWLALDRNGNGTIDDASELFGNTTPQTPSGDQNGFLALAEFDKTENGGNADGYIDKHDAIYSKLRVWIDSNHNGYSESSELYSLQQLKIERIELRYRVSHYADKYGNQFRYKSRLWDDRGLESDQRTHDVYLQQAP